MTDRPRISVVIPAYQAARFIGEAVQSVLDQDEQPAEIVVIDDGSTDGTADIVGSFGPRVSLIRRANGGESSARNTGLQAASCAWVSFLDADDRYLPGRLRAVGDVLEAERGLDVVTTDAYLESAGTIVRRCYEDDWPFADQDQRQEILRRNFVFGHVTANRQRLLDLGGFDESIRHAADWAMWIRLLLDGGRIGVVREPLSVYRLHDASMSADRVAIERGCVQSLEAALRNPALRHDESVTAKATLAEHRRLLDRARLSVALGDGASGVRRLALTVARAADQSRRVRLGAAASAIAPGLAGRVVRRRRRGMVIGTTGRLVPAAPANHATR